MSTNFCFEEVSCDSPSKLHHHWPELFSRPERRNARERPAQNYSGPLFDDRTATQNDEMPERDQLKTIQGHCLMTQADRKPRPAAVLSSNSGSEMFRACSLDLVVLGGWKNGPKK